MIMNIIPIESKNLSPWGIANGVEIKVPFVLGMETFDITVQFYDEQTPVGAPVLMPVNPGILQQWATVAANHPEKAGFLDFQIVTEWCFQQLDCVRTDI